MGYSGLWPHHAYVEGDCQTFLGSFASFSLAVVENILLQSNEGKAWIISHKKN